MTAPLREHPREHQIRGLRIKRKVGEKIILFHKGEAIVIQFIALWSGGVASLAIESGAEVKIYRHEIFKVEGEK